MSPQKLRSLLLPQLVEERRRRDDIEKYMSFDIDENFQTIDNLLSLVSTCSFSQKLDPSGEVSPVESIFTNDSSGSLSSQSLGFRSRRPSLPNVQEETYESDDSSYLSKDEIDTTYTEINDSELYCCLCDDPHCLHRNTTDNDVLLNSFPKRSISDKKSMTRFVSRLGTKFSSISTRWTGVKHDAQSTTSFQPFPNISHLDVTGERSYDKTPTKHNHEQYLSQTPKYSAHDIKDTEEKRILNSNDQVHEEPKYIPTQSPFLTELPNSNRKFSKSSIRQATALPGPVSSSTNDVTIDESEITQQKNPLPSLKIRLSNSSLIAPPICEFSSLESPGTCDEWAEKLGHDNFTILPEPYLPPIYDVETYRKFLYDWDLARYNYTQYIACICEHCGVTSKIYHLTEEKWSAISRVWGSNNELIFKFVHGENCLSTNSEKPLPVEESVSASMSSDSLGGKVDPPLDEEIVAPVEEVKECNSPQLTRKARILNYLKKRKSFRG